MPVTRLASSVAFLASLVLAVPPLAYAQDADSTTDGELDPIVQIQSQAYSKARASFHTRLVHRGPAPEPDTMPPTPPGVTLVTYPSGGLKLNAWIKRPPAAAGARQRAVVFIHGGFSFGPHDWEMAQAFFDAGYVLMEPTLRGENRQKGDFSLFYDEVDDVIAAAKWLARQSYVAPNGIFVVGHSNGGTLALLAAMASPMFRGAASFSGSPDQAIFCKYGFDGVVPFDTTSTREFEMRSPLSFAKSFRCPARIYYGTEEPYFHRSSQALAKAARESGLDVTADRINGGHFSALKEERRRTLEFFGGR